MKQPVAGAEQCVRCGAPIVRRRRRATHPPDLCLACIQRARQAAYQRAYYLAHRERILEKNRRWARENKPRLAELRQAGQTPIQEQHCVDCGTLVVRAQRCRRCAVRFRYATDPVYRERRLERTRRWDAKRRRQG